MMMTKLSREVTVDTLVHEEFNTWTTLLGLCSDVLKNLEVGGKIKSGVKSGSFANPVTNGQGGLLAPDSVPLFGYSGAKLVAGSNIN